MSILSRLNYRNKKYLFILLIVVLLIELSTLVISSLTPNKIISKDQNKLEAYADKVMTNCASASQRPSCYDKEIPRLMDYISMEDAFRVTKFVQQKDPNTYEYCHVLGHNLSARETKKDPDRWKEIIPRCPSGMCSNGCIHGAFQERFRTDVLSEEQLEKLKPELSYVCEPRANWKPTGMEQATCYHALGHLLMYITNADSDKATKICEEITAKNKDENLLRVCYDGAFMQIFQPLEPEDFALIKGKQPQKEQLASFCGAFDEKRKGACWVEGWPLYFEEIITSKGLTKFCYFLKDPYQRKRCFSGLFYVITAQFHFDLDRIKDVCVGLPKEWIGQCFANAASRIIETDKQLINKSIDVCQLADTFGVGEECYNELLIFSTFNFHKGSAEFTQLCNSLPDSWKDKCFKR